MRKTRYALLFVVLLALACAGQEVMDFGSVPVGIAVSATYTLRNTNLFSCSIEAIGFGEDYNPASQAFSIPILELPISVESGGMLPLTVTFRPPGNSSYQDNLLIRLRCGIFVQNLTIPLRGLGGGGSTGSTTDVTMTDPTGLATGCGCESEISLVTAQINSLTALVQTQLAPSLAQIQADLAGLDSSEQITSGTDDVCPGPFPQSGGQRFLDFVTAQRALAVQAAADLPKIQSDEPSQQALLQAGANYLSALVTELDTVTQQLLTLAPEHLPCFDSYVPAGTTEYLDAVLNVASDASTHPKLGALFESSGMDVAGTVWDKIKIWIGHIPGVGGILQSAMEDVDALTDSSGDTLAIASMLFQYEMERKLDGIIYGLFGIEIPPNATEAELMALLRRITSDSLADRLGRLEQAAEEQASDLEEIGERLEEVGATADQALESGLENGREIAILEDKVCCFIWAMNRFGEELGDALYGDRGTFSNMLPSVCSATTYAQCFGSDHTTAEAFPEDVERDAIKPEIRNLEADMVIVKLQLEELLRRLGDPDLIPLDETPPTIVPPFTPVFPVTEETDDHNLLLVTKKIYVYAEDTFAATSAADVHDIIVTTPAFDVSGWIDATQLQPGDTLQVELTIRIDGNERPWMTTSFSGGADSRLIYFDELTGGRTFIVGAWIRIRLIQTTSSDGFQTPVPVGYQFIVQSQR